MAIEEAQTLTSKLGKSTTKRSTYQPSDSMSLYSGAAGTSVMSSVSGGLSSKVAQIKLDNRTDAKEDRKLDRIAAEAQAFLLQNNHQNKNTVSDAASSISSIAKGTIYSSTSTKGKGKTNKNGTTKNNNTLASVASAKTSFSKQGKTLACSKLL